MSNIFNPSGPMFSVTSSVLKTSMLVIPDQSFSQDCVKLFLGVRDIS